MIIKENISLQEYNTFKLAIKAKRLIEIRRVEDLLEVIQSGILKEGSFLILGGGSNVLFKGDYDGTILLNCISGIETRSIENNKEIVKAGGGEVWEDLVYFCVERNIGGIENLCIIPGTVGAAPIQNIGAYGVELKDTFHSLEAVNLESGEMQKFNKQDCHFGYRDSIFKNEYKGKYFVTYVSLELEKEARPDISYGAIQQELEKLGLGGDPDISGVCNAVASIRRAKLPDPDILGNAGSFFKNPVIGAHQFETLKATYPKIPYYQFGAESYKIPAGWLIEQCGWKGRRRGDAGVHELQALVIVNHGNASGHDILGLAEDVKASVAEKFSIDLEMEVNLI
jgi:UDP-N-acetylmuramate dehydrogenase